MTPNPYTPPTANVDNVSNPDAAPPLWNPNTAANWSLLFSPAFGAFIQMKNWQSLGEQEKAANAKIWAIVSLVVLVGSMIFPVIVHHHHAIKRLVRWAPLVLLLSWYFASARSQTKYVADRFGKTYPRRGWLMPLALALVALIAYIAVTELFGNIMDEVAEDADS